MGRGARSHSPSLHSMRGLHRALGHCTFTPSENCEDSRPLTSNAFGKTQGHQTVKRGELHIICTSTQIEASRPPHLLYSAKTGYSGAVKIQMSMSMCLCSINSIRFSPCSHWLISLVTLLLVRSPLYGPVALSLSLMTLDLSSRCCPTILHSHGLDRQTLQRMMRL